jgi:hypothetical protein
MNDNLLNDIKEIENISEKHILLKKFYRTLSLLFKIGEKIDEKNIHLLWIKNQVALGRRLDEDEIIFRMKDKLWEYREQIINRNEDFFKNNQFSKFIKNDDRKKLMYSMINMFKNKISGLSKEGRDEIWNLIQLLLACCIKYKELIGDFN